MVSIHASPRMPAVAHTDHRAILFECMASAGLNACAPDADEFQRNGGSGGFCALRRIGARLASELRTATSTRPGPAAIDLQADNVRAKLRAWQTTDRTHLNQARRIGTTKSKKSRRPCRQRRTRWPHPPPRWPAALGLEQTIGTVDRFERKRSKERRVAE